MSYTSVSTGVIHVSEDGQVDWSIYTSISICGYVARSSRLARQTLDGSFTHESCPFDTGPFHSVTELLAVLEMLPGYVGAHNIRLVVIDSVAGAYTRSGFSST